MSTSKNFIDTLKWVEASQTVTHHAGTWDLEYWDDRNWVTRIYSHSCNMAFLEDRHLKLVLISQGAINAGKLKLLRHEFLEEDMLFLLIEAGDVLFNITTYAKGMTKEDFDDLSQLTICELLVEDSKLMHQKMAILALDYLPKENIRSEADLLEQLSILMSLNYFSYVIGLISNEEELQTVFMGLNNPVEGVHKSYVRSVALSELHSPY